MPRSTDLRAGLRPFQRILIAVDGGAPAERAAFLGCSLAEALGGEVCLFHALERVPTAIVTDPDPEAEPKPIHGAEIFDALLAKLPQHVQISNLSHVGEAAKSIEWAIETWSPDLLVIGSHGRDGVARAMLGSVAEATMRHSPCPVLVVKSWIVASA
ncbi:MAG TPA: universal stress protein [Caulobacteraceae bacterium]|nr:universal stress protein [Caulobacteraceae bacterium]